MSDEASISSDPSPAADETPVAPARLAPAISHRFASVDVLRGVAVLGILAMNIYAFAMPFPAYGNPLLYGGSSGLDLAVWFFTHLFFDQKFLPVFSMLFGAGLVMMFERAEAKGAKLAGVHYRRTFWLLVFGMVHAYLIWMGDILVAYALLGFILFLFRRRKPRTLLLIGIPVFLMGVPISYMMGGYFAGVQQKVVEAKASRDAGETLSPEIEKKIEEWDAGMGAFIHPSAELIEKDIATHRGSYGEIVVNRVPMLAMFQIFGFLTFSLWRAGGLMLIGMALMKWGVFTAERSTRFYVKMLVFGYGLGLPVVGWSAYTLYDHGFDGLYGMKYGIHFNWVGSIGVSLGHVAVVMLAVKLGWFTALVDRLAAVGRMAFTNYLSHSLLLTPIFYGYGLGLYGRFDRGAQMGFVVAVWILQLWWSALWLRHFRFGPFEWLWRSLTYWRRQPMKLADAPQAAMATDGLNR